MGGVYDAGDKPIGIRLPTEISGCQSLEHSHPDCPRRTDFEIETVIPPDNECNSVCLSSCRFRVCSSLPRSESVGTKYRSGKCLISTITRKVPHRANGRSLCFYYWSQVHHARLWRQLSCNVYSGSSSEEATSRTPTCSGSP